MWIKKLIFIGLIFLISSTGWATTYYVDNSGCGDCDTYRVVERDCGSGSETVRDTIAEGLALLSAGDTLNLRQGTYQEEVSFSTNGTSENRITIQGYMGETATIDGYSTIPASCSTYLVSIAGDYVTLKNVYIIDSNGSGLYLGGDYTYAENVYGDGFGESGFIANGTGNIFDGVTVIDNGNRYGAGCSTWGAALAAGPSAVNVTIKNSISHDNYGEGISSYYGADGTTIEDNISYNNGVPLYLDSTTNVIAQRNLLYDTGAGPRGDEANDCITIGGEIGQPSDLTIINNFCAGNFRHTSLSTDSNVTQLVNVTIAYNTFLDCDNQDGYNWNIYFRSNIDTYTNSIFKDNIIDNDNDDATTSPIWVESSHSGLTFSYNSWYETPMAAAQGTGDVTENDPCERDGNFTPGNLTGNHFKQKSDSLTIDAGNAVAGIIDDYWQCTRPMGLNPDIGGHEYKVIVETLQGSTQGTFP